MLDFLRNLFLPSQYIPHGHCYLWQTPLVWLHVSSDAVTAIAYFSIPALLFYFVRKRDDVPFSNVFILFAAFIVFCGAGHLLDILTLWYPVYWLSGTEHALTAIVSGYAAFRLTELLPQFLSLKSPIQLEAMNQQLQQQIAERKRAEAMLEIRVQERTAELLQANAGLAAEIEERVAAEAKLKQVAERERTIARIIQHMRGSLNLDTIFSATTEEVREALSCDRTLIYRFSPDWSGSVVSESVAAGWSAILPAHRADPALTKILVDRSGCVVRQLDGTEVLIQDTYLQESSGGIYQRSTSYCCVTDVEEAGFEPCYLNLLRAIQARAYAIVPIFCGQQLWGLLCAYQNSDPRQWQPTEVRMLSQIASQLGVAVQQAELFAQTQEQARALQRSEARFRSAFDAASVGMALIGVDDRWLKVNSVLGDILGYDEAELLSTTISALIHPDDRAKLQAGMTQLHASEARGTQLELRYCCKGGRIAYGLLSLSLVRDDQDQPLYYVAQIQDITEQRAIDQMKSEFVSIVSHELRTPLTAIRGYLGLLDTGIYDDQPDKAKQMVSYALDSSDRLTRLVDDILELERLAAGNTKLELETCSATELIDRAVEGVQLLADQASITLAPLPAAVRVWAVPHSIIQVLTNLLSNAIKFSAAQTTISLSATAQGDAVLFWVADQGRGIPADKLKTIFGRFQQVDASDARQKGGTGLGLAICQTIVQQHGGRIWVESLLGQGSTFYFTLPTPSHR